MTIEKEALYEILVQHDLLETLSDGPTCVMLSQNGQKIWVALERAEDKILARGESFQYEYSL